MVSDQEMMVIASNLGRARGELEWLNRNEFGDYPELEGELDDIIDGLKEILDILFNHYDELITDDGMVHPNLLAHSNEELKKMKEEIEDELEHRKGTEK